MIRPSKSPFGAPLLFLKSKGKPLRSFVDYRVLNRLTRRNSSPILRSDEIFDRLGGAKYFSKMDLKTGFHQIRVRPKDVDKRSFNTKYGQYEFLVISMWLVSAPATFATLMNHVLKSLADNFYVVYREEILHFSMAKEEHYIHLCSVLSRLQDHNLSVSLQKCSLMTRGVEFIGSIVDYMGIKENPEEAKVMQD